MQSKAEGGSYEKLIASILVASMVLLLGGCCLQHQWLEADCEHPETCSKCGKTQGEALGHTWEEATCKAPKTSTRCGKTEGEPLSHKPGEWEVTEADYVKLVAEYQKKCTACGEILETKEEDIKTLVAENAFILMPAEFMERLAACLETFRAEAPQVTPITIDADFPSSPGYALFAGEKLMAHVIFLSDPSDGMEYKILQKEDMDNGTFDSIYILYNVDDEVLSQYGMEMGMIQNCVVRASDPSLGEKECGDLVLRVLHQWVPGESAYEIVNGLYQGFGSILGVLDQLVIVDK